MPSFIGNDSDFENGGELISRKLERAKNQCSKKSRESKKLSITLLSMAWQPTEKQNEKEKMEMKI